MRLGLYRRLSQIENDAEMESFGAELIDRFGPLPPEVEQLLRIVTIKILCRDTNVEKVEAGPKGVVIHFRDKSFANPQGLVAYVRGAGVIRQGAARHEHRVHPRADLDPRAAQA